MRSITEVDKQKPSKASRMAESVSCLLNCFSTHCKFALLSCCLTNVVSVVGTTSVIHWHCISPGTSLTQWGFSFLRSLEKQDGGFSVVSSHMDSLPLFAHYWAPALQLSVVGRGRIQPGCLNLNKHLRTEM